MIEKSVKAPLTYNPGKGRPKEHLAYLNKGEMKALRLLNGNNVERGPSDLPSFPPADAAGSSSRASSSKPSGSSSVSRISGGTAGSNAARSASSSSNRSSSSGGGGGRDSGQAANRPSPSSSRPSSSGGGGARDSGQAANRPASSPSRPSSSGGGGARDSGQAANRPTSGSGAARISGGTPNSNQQRYDRLQRQNLLNAYYRSGFDPGMTYNPMVMRDQGSYLVGGGPGAPSVLVSPGYESYLTDSLGRKVPVGNILQNYMKNDPTALVGIRTLGGVNPDGSINYYKAAQQVQMRPIDYTKETNNDRVYGYMDRNFIYSPAARGYIAWDPYVVVTPEEQKTQPGMDQPIPSPTGLGIGSLITRGNLQTLTHELQHVGQFSHLLTANRNPIPGQRPIIDTKYVNYANKAYDPAPTDYSLDRGIETMNREIDIATSGNKNDSIYEQGAADNAFNYLKGTNGYSGSYAENLAEMSAADMRMESENMLRNKTYPGADSMTVRTMETPMAVSPRYVVSPMQRIVEDDYRQRQEAEGVNRSAKSGYMNIGSSGSSSGSSGGLSGFQRR